MERASLNPTESGFVLKRDGQELAHLTDEEVLAIANNAPNLRQTIMTRSYPPGAVFATPVSTVLVRSDALGHNVLVQFGTGQSGQTVFELERSVAQQLIHQLLELSVPDFSSQQ